jgi:hypothetical protein
VSQLKNALKHYLEGAANLFDFAGALFSLPKSEVDHRSIGQSLESDWKMIGRDMQKAIERFGSQSSEVQK